MTTHTCSQVFTIWAFTSPSEHAFSYRICPIKFIVFFLKRGFGPWEGSQKKARYRARVHLLQGLWGRFQDSGPPCAGCPIRGTREANSLMQLFWALGKSHLQKLQCVGHFCFHFKSQVNLSLKSLQTNGIFFFLNHSDYVTTTLKAPLRQSRTAKSTGESFWMLSMKSPFRY